MTNNEAEQGVLASLSNDLARAVERAGNSTVTVQARRRVPASGIVWSGDGVILTADHVVERDEDIKIGLPDGSEVGATVVARDPGTDLAVLRVQSGSLTVVEHGPVPGVGSLVLAVARPGGEGTMATLGVVSAVGGPVRTWRGGSLDRFVRSDAILYPGFSGGPLVDAGGRVVGINTSHLARGSGITIPVATAGRVVEALLSHGRVQRGYLGIGSQPVELPAAVAAKTGRGRGLLTVGVVPNGPADKAGVMLGDILISLNGEATEDTDDLQRVLNILQVGQTAGVGILRGGEPRDLQVTIGERS